MLAILTSLLLGPSSAGSVPPAQVQAQLAAGRWQIDVAPARCRLTRNFASASPPYSMSVQSVPGSQSYQITIAGEALKEIAQSASSPASLSFENGAAIAGRAVGVRLQASKSPAVRMHGVPPVLLDRLADNVAFGIQRSGRSVSPLVLGSAAKAVAALRKCETDQLVDWGADPTQFQTGGATPIATMDRESWLSTVQVMRIMAGRDAVSATFKVGITDDGRIDTCFAVPPDDPGITAIACKGVIGRSLFTPAKAPDGRAVRGAATFALEIRTITQVTSTP